MRKTTKKTSTITLTPNMSFDKTLGYTIYLNDVAVMYISGTKRKALTFIARLKQATVTP